MPKYISLDDINRYPIRRGRCDESMKDDPFICGIESVMDSVNRQPMLDIVFCKDCKRWNRGYFQEYMCHSDVITGPNDFCSYGERE